MVMERLQAALVSTYRIERELGGGGMSRVFVATERALDRPVVLKVLPPELAQAVSIERFHQEIRLAARLQHPHIVALLSAGDADGLLYYTMPFIEGESLRVRIARGGELPVRDALRVLRDVAAALAYAHEHAVVHRDIKPDNVLLSGGEALVTDFGVAKALSASATGGGSGLTSLGVAIGTPAYMAPEQAAADPLTDHRADIYAFGCVAYELLTGQPPFAGRSPQALLAAHATEAVEPVIRRRPTLPPALAALVMRCLERRPADRPQRAAHVLQALEGMGTPSEGTAPTVALRARGRLRPVTIALGAAVGLILGLGAVQAWRQYGSSPDASVQKSIAVLPLSSLAGDTTDQYFSDGISQEIIGALGRVPGLLVAGRTSSFRYRGTDVDPAEVGRQLRVASLMSGTIQRRGDAVRVRVEVVDTRSGYQLWSGRYDRSAADLFALEDEIATAVARALAVELVGNGSGVPPRRDSVIPEVHDLSLRASALWERADSASLYEALSLYERALVLDSSYAPAWAGLSDVHTMIADAYEAPKVAVPKAKAAALRALALDDSLASPHLLLAEIADAFEWNYSLAATEFRRALALDPNSPDAHLWYGQYLAVAEQDDEGADREMNRAAALDPLNPQIVFYQIFLAVGQGRFDRALTLTERLQSLVGGPTYYKTNPLAFVYGAMGHWRECVMATSPEDEALRALCDARDGRPEPARRLVKKLEDRTRTRYVDGTAIAYLHAALGDTERTFQWLERAVADRSANARSIRTDFRLGPEIRADPRYDALLATMGLPRAGPPRGLEPAGGEGR